MANTHAPGKPGNIVPKTLAALLEALNIAWITAICAKVIGIYSEDPIPVLSFFFPGLHVNDILAFSQALVIVLLPIFVFRQALGSTLFSSPGRFFSKGLNGLYFVLGLLGLAGVYTLELFNLVQGAQLALESVVDCGANNPFCNQAEVDAKRRQLERQLENALPLAFLFSTVNLTIGFGTAALFRPKQ